MNANSASAAGAAISIFLINNELLHAVVSYAVQVFNKTHTIFGSILFIQSAQLSARVVVTFKTILDSIFFQ